MRDIVVLIFVIVCIGAAIRKPWWGVLSLAVFSYLNPHAYAWGFATQLPAFQILFLVVAAATFVTKDKQPLPKDWRITVFILLWLFFIVTTPLAFVPDAAWEKLWIVSKTFIPFIFTLLLINTREKLFYLIVTIAWSIGIIGVKGGIFAVATGFSYRVYGPPFTQFEENNAMAIAVLIAAPLMLLIYREAKNKWLRLASLGAVPFLYASSLSSWSRGALLAMTGMTLFLLQYSKRKYLAVPILAIGAVVAVQYLPDSWFARMNTIETYEEDKSASNRLEAWRDGLNFTLRHPLAGAGFEGWRWVTARDWHSAYVEMFAEHGFIAFGMWLSLIIGTLVNLTRLARRAKGIEGMQWVINYSQMLRASFIAYMIGTTFLGLSYWDLLYHLIFISVLVTQFAEKEFDEHIKISPPVRERFRDLDARRPQSNKTTIS